MGPRNPAANQCRAQSSYHIIDPARWIRPHHICLGSTRFSEVIGAISCAHSALGLWVLIEHSHDCHSDCDYCHNSTDGATMVHQVSTAVTLN